jgi:hypothetical protein
MDLYIIQTRFAVLTGKSVSVVALIFTFNFAVLTGKSVSVVALIFTFNFALYSLLYTKHLADIMKPYLHRLRLPCSLSE